MVDASKLKAAIDCKGKLKEIVGDEGLEQLAKEGLCPHYILINPLTEERTYCFIPSELNEWYARTYIKHVEGDFTPKMTFLYFDKTEHRIKQDDSTPIELCKLDEVYELPISAINTPPGIYFLYKDDKMQYIGQSVSISTRIITHISEGFKEFNRVFFIPCPANKLDLIETSLIKYFKPPLNKTCLSCASPKELQIAESLFLKQTA